MVDTASSPARCNILGVGVSTVNMERAVERITDTIQADGRGYVCVTGVHGIIEAQDDEAFRTIQNRSLLTVPDGMPTVWIGRAAGHRDMDRVYGPDLMKAVCAVSSAKGLRHFLYGGKPGVPEKLKAWMSASYPGITVVGCYSPPFRPLNDDEERALADQVAAAKPDILWVGLSTPKQERFMAAHLGSLAVPVMIGVGAAFDVHTGSLRDAPDWVKRAGLQWLHRLFQEPRRLWRRYLINNPRFLYLLLLQKIGVRRRSTEDSGS